MVVLLVGPWGGAEPSEVVQQRIWYWSEGGGVILGTGAKCTSELDWEKEKTGQLLALWKG
jgi:hypothetical protein